MPSQAFKHFRVNMIDVYRLIESHNEISPNHRGKRALGHLTHSGVVMLCACWELYNESLIIESARYLANKLDSPFNLPIDVQKHLAKHVKEARHDLKPLEMSGLRWRSVYDAACCNEVKALNTPKAAKLEILFKNYLGFSDVVSKWPNGKNDIDDFVTLRGNIAHNGRFTDYVTITELNTYCQLIYQTCLAIDSEMCTFLHTTVGSTVQPWRKAPK
ncbi:HEPN domain-containing protein [Acinetobacter sp. 5862]|uniref:HEPN domain-containing protein n=1 Tax=Acinetobacter sp. 5862 TaxID=2967169 RepID=UPI0021119CD6|nr:HEPN domain-containing protein [Acinetobacter sp. 5862]